MEDIVGQMTERSANDFSKIQARFKVKMQLTSKDAKTVIQQRLLAKSKDAVSELEAMYEKNKEDFRVLFDFADGSKSYKTYQDVQDFVDTYPFVPYQFDLFITAMRGLSDYNAFTGRHHSTGARSMLGVFQDVGAKLVGTGATTEEEALAPFDAMFEGLRNSIKGEVCGQISIAENQLTDNPLAIRVLKALFLVKYCKDFRATAKNLRVLLYGSFRENTSALEQNIKDVLAELEHQLYVRKSPNSNIYEYLTDEEKDIEKEIRNIPVSNSDIETRLAELFTEVVGQRRVSYQNGSFSYNFSYNFKVNGNSQGPARNDLSVNIVTEYSSDGMIDVSPAAPKTLGIVLQNADDFLNNLRVFEQTNKFANLSDGSGEVRQAIIQDKRAANNALASKLAKDFAELLANASYNAAGVDVTSSISGVGKASVESGMQELIRRSYTGLQQLKSSIVDNDVYSAAITVRPTPDLGTPEYVETVFTRIGLLSGASAVTIGGDGLSSLKAVFTKNEFGWPEIYVRHAIAILYAQGRVEVRKAGSLVEGTNLANALKRDVEMDKYVVSKMQEVAPEQLSAINQAFRNVVGTNPEQSDAKAIAAELHRHIDSMTASLKLPSNQLSGYPFATYYTDCFQQLEKASKDANDNWSWIINPFPGIADNLAQAKDDLSKMKQFVDGSGPGKRWQEIKEFANDGLVEAQELQVPSLAEGDVAGKIYAILNDSSCYKSGELPALANSVKRIKDEVIEAKEALRKSACDQLDAYKASFESSYDISKVSEVALNEFKAIFDTAKSQVGAIAAAYQIKGYFESFKNTNSSRLIALVTPTPQPATPSEPDAGTGEEETPLKSTNTPITVQLSKLNVAGYTKPAISTIQDIEDYISALRDILHDEVEAGHTIIR